MENNNIFDTLIIDDIEAQYPIDDDNKEEETMTEETIATIEEVTTTTTNNKEEETMTEEKTIITNEGEKVTCRIINQVTLEKINGKYDWKYTRFKANGMSMASEKKEYTPKTEYSLEWELDPEGKRQFLFYPKFLKIAPRDKRDNDFMSVLENVLFSLNNIIPEAITDKDGNVKIAVFASQGGVKSGERYYVDPTFVEKYKKEGSMVEYSADPLMPKYLELRRAISIKEFDLIPLYLNSVWDKSLVDECEVRKAEMETMIHELKTLRESMTCPTIYRKFGVANANQVTAFFYTPCKKKGDLMNVKIMDEVKTKVACDGYVDTHNEESWDVQDKMEGKDPYMEISIDDGSAFVDRNYAKEHGFFGGEVKDMTQARSSVGYKDGVKTEIALDFKGTIQLVNMPEGMKDAIYVSSSCAKALKRFSKKEIESCEYQFYTMDRNVHIDGTIEMSPQVLMYGLTQADDEDMEKLIARQVEELNELKNVDGYKKLVAQMTKTSYWTSNWNRIGTAPYGKNLEGKLVGATVRKNHEGECSFKRITSIAGHAAFSDLGLSKMFIFSAAKEATAMYNRLLAGKIVVEGASAKAQGDVVAILRSYQAQQEERTVSIEDVAYIPADNVIVPKEWEKRFHLEKGQKLFIYRNPYNATIGCIVTIFGFSNLRDTIQMSALDNNGHKLASDNDGDTIYISWNETIIKIFENANQFAKNCGARVLAYRTGEEDVSKRGIPADEYLAFAPANSSVGLVCEPLFGLISLIPVGCKNPDEYIHLYYDYNGKDVFTTPREIYRLLDHGFVGTTYTIDAAKKHYVNAYEKTSQSKRISKIINKGVYWTKVFYHPTEVKYDPQTDMIIRNKKEYPRIGENGGLAVMAKKAMNEVWPNPTNNGVIIRYTDILNGYKIGTVDSEINTTKGFVFCPSDEFTGIDKDVFLKKTNYNDVDGQLAEGGLILNVPELATKNVPCGDKFRTGIEFKSWLIKDMAERTDDMEESEKYKAVSLASWAGHDLTIGVLRARLLRACNNLTIFDGWYNNKGNARDNVDTHMIKVIKMWMRAFCEVECTDGEAMDILYNEIAVFLFSGKADEAYAPDIQSFLGNRNFVNRLFEQEKIWLKNKIKTGEVEFKKLTAFEKDLVMGKIDTTKNSDEE